MCQSRWLLMCTFGDDCQYKDIFHHKRIAVEIKSPFPQAHVPKHPYYEMPQCHVPQITAEMVALESDELWFVCCTNNLVTLNIANYAQQIWDTIMTITDDFYSPLKPPIPTRLHKLVKPLKADIKKYVTTHCNFTLEVPGLSGTYGEMKQSEHGSPYNVALDLKKIAFDIVNIQERSRVLSTECCLIFTEAHHCLRELAREIIVYMLNCKNRIHEELIPNSSPVAYTMKGKSLNIAQLCYLTDILQWELLKRNINMELQHLPTLQ